MSGKSDRRCPICDKPQDTKYKPFCSKRCADVDLNRWLTGSYAVPVEEDDSEGINEEAGDTRPQPLH
jgi:hypothetical protein